jgi:uncharacterized membrane protein
MMSFRRATSTSVPRFQLTCSLHRLFCRENVFLLLAAVLISRLGIPCTAQAQQLQQLQHHVRAEVLEHRAALAGAMPANQQIHASIVLPLRNSAALTSLLSRLYDPTSPDYRHFLTVAQFTDQFGPTSDDFQAVVAFAQANGLTVTQLPANRLVVPVTGTVAQINAAFNVQMNLYQHPTENRTFFSPDREPSLNLSVPIAHISGLDNFSLPRPMSVRAPNAQQAATVTGSGPGGSYLGTDMRAAYYGGTTLNGNGQAVGLFEFDGYLLSDVNLTFSNAGQTYTVPINNVLLDGVTGAPLGNDGEQVLDIVQPIGMAPALSQVRVYIGFVDSDILNSMASENIAKQLSCSWSWQPADPTADDVFFQEMAAQGQSFFVASGDNGAFDVAVSPYFYPQEDQYITAVGGTHLTTAGAGGGWTSETVWNSGGNGSGGGISPDNISIPSWQVGLATTANGGSATLRNVPDVAMEGDFDNYNCQLGSCAGDWAGTSFAAPRWAGFMALVNQQAVESGNAPSGGLGFINPAIYRLSQSTVTTSSPDFHDITVGNNDTANQPIWFNAETGYDLTTGWGSANGQQLINDLAGTQVPGFWLDSAQSTIAVNPGGTATATLSITGADGFTGSVNLAVTSALPTGVTASFSPNPATASSVLTLTASSSAPAANQAITIAGTSGTLTASTNVTVGVHAPNFNLAASPATLGINQGASGTSTISVLPLYGFTGAVNLSVSGLPAGVTASFSPVSTTGTSTLTVTASSTATSGNSTLTITGTSGNLTATTTVSLSIHGPSFTLFSTGAVSIGQGSNGTTYIYVNDQYGFTGNVNFAVSGLPNGVTASFSPNPTSGSSALTFTASSSASVGQSVVTITGTSGALSATTTVNLGVFAPTFTLYSSGSVNIGQGASGTSYVSISPQYGFSGNVTFSLSGLPSGVTALWSPNPTTNTSTLTLAVSSTAKAGQYPLTITGVSGSVTATTTLTLGIYAPTFTLSDYSSMNIGQGTSATSYVYVNPQYGFTGSVNLAVSGLPSGVTAAFATNPTTGTSALTLTASSTAALGQYTLTITGTSGTQTASTTLSLGIYAPTFTLSDYASVTVGQGTSSTSYVYIYPQYGFVGSVNFAVSGLPSGVTASFSPNPTTGTSTLTLTASSTAPLGQYTLTITGTSGTQTASTTLTLGIYQPGFTLYDSASVTVGQGTTTSTYVNVSSQYGFTGSVNLSVSGLPSGVTASFSPNPTTGNSTLTLTASSTAATGQYPLTITGTSGGATVTTNLTLSVAVPSFTLSAYGVSAGQGSSASSYIYVNSQYGFAGGVNLSVSGLPSGVTASFSPNPTNSSSTLNLNIAASAPVGTSTVTVTGTSGSETVTTTFQLGIFAPSFTLFSSTYNLSLNPGASGTDNVYISPQYGFAGNVALTVSGLPSGVTASFSPNPATGTGSTLTLSASSNAAPGQSTITITGTSGSLTTSTSFTLTINSPGFTITSAPSTVLLFPGSSETATVTAVSQNGFSGNINYVVSGLPSGVTASFSPNPSTGTSILTLSAAATATPVSGTAAITATSGSLTATTVLSVAVRPSRTATTTTLVLTPGSSSVASGTTVTATATVSAGSTPLNTGQVNLCDATGTVCDAIHLLGSAQLTNAGTAVFQFIPGPGNHSYKAVFAGTNSNGTSSSSAVNLAVTAMTPSTTTIAQSGSAGNYTLTAAVTGEGAVAPSGKVSFVDTTNGNAVLNSATLSGGTAVFSFSNKSQSLPVGSEPLSVVTADFNGDGIPDLAVTNSYANTITTLLGNGAGTFTSDATLQTGNGPSAIVAGDFNRDGHVDLAVTTADGNGSNTNGVNIFLGNGDGTFTPSSQSPLAGAQPSAMTVGDYNGDGLLDLAVVDYGSSTLTVLLGNGDGTFTPANLSPQIGSYPNSIAQGDFNGDGIPDLAITNSNSQTVTILLGAGDGTFGSIGTFPTGSYPNSIAAGDLNGDGKLDLVIGNGSNAVTILLGNGDGTFTAATGPSIGTGNARIALADLNGDGKMDLITANYYNSNITVFLGNGDGTFASGITAPVGTTPVALAVGDWNGDGIRDVVAVNSNSSTLTVLTSQLAQKATASASGIAPLGQGEHAVEASYAGDNVYTGSTSNTVPLTAVLSLTAANASRAFGAPNPPFTGTITGVVNGDVLTETFSTTAVPTSPVGTYPIVPAVTGANAGNYTIQVTNGVLTIVPANTTTSLALSNGNLTFTATVASATSGVPTGSVSFYSGQTLLGTGTLANGVASYTATSFPTGDAILSAQYSGDTNFVQSTSASIPVFTVTPGNTSLNVSQAGSVSDVLTLAVASGYSGTLQFTCNGLPQNATCSFSPSSVAFTGSTSSATSTLTVQTGGVASLSLPASHFGGSRTTTWAAMLGLPSLLALALASRRRRLGAALRMMALLLLLCGAANSLTGCAGGGSSGSKSSSTTTPPGTYTVQVVTSGASGLTQTTSLSVTVQ